MNKLFIIHVLMGEVLDFSIVYNVLSYPGEGGGDLWVTPTLNPEPAINSVSMTIESLHHSHTIIIYVP